MRTPFHEPDRTLDTAHAFDIDGPKARLCMTEAGGLEIIHESTLLQIGVYALVAPEPDRQRVNTADELYIVLEGRGWLDVEGEHLELREGHAVFVPAAAEHRFSAYEHLSVLAILARKPEIDVRTKHRRARVATKLAARLSDDCAGHRRLVGGRLATEAETEAGTRQFRA